MTGNLLKNANLMASSSWNGNVTDDIESQAWEIVSNRGDGIQLEKTAEGKSTTELINHRMFLACSFTNRFRVHDNCLFCR